jgi:hypothetical protein
MKNKLLLIIILALLFSMSTTSLFGADFTNSDVALRGYEKLTSVIEENFKQSGDTIMAIPNLDRQAADWKSIRELKTKLWLQLLDQIDRARDLNFDFSDFKNGYTANVSPPDFRYNSGIDPADIKEPDVRLEYEEAIEENRAKETRLNFELQLKKQDEQLTVAVVQFCNFAYNKTSEDANELAGYLDIISDARHQAELKLELNDLLEPSRVQAK